MKKFLIVTFCVLAFASVQAQKVKIQDTINATVLQKFNAPSVGALVLGNCLKLNYSAELLDANLNKIRAVRSSTQKPRKEDFAKVSGRGITAWFFLTDYIEKPGVYYIKVSIDVVGETGPLKQDVYYLINVSNPTLAAPVNLRAAYYPGEKEAFSFATSEFSDLNLYSYEISESGGAVLMQGKGPIVKLDSVLKSPNSVGKKIKVRGMYEGNEFTYIDPTSKKVENSTWEFSLEKPSLEEFNQWQKKEDDQWLISVYNATSKAFMFVYIGYTPNGFAVTCPEVNGLRVTSDPENFVTSASSRKNGSFRVVDIAVNPDFLDQMKTGDEQKIKVTISFRTQFGEPVKKDYYAVVIK